MEGRFPRESEGLGPAGGGGVHIGVTPGVNDESALLVDGFTPTRYELGIIARHYLTELGKIKHMWRLTTQTGSWEIRYGPFARRRLYTIEQALGEKAFEEEIGDVRAEWEAEFEKLDEQEAALSPCKRCGGKRDLADDVLYASGLCGKCVFSEMEDGENQRETGV